MSGTGSAGWGSPFPGKNWKNEVRSEFGYRVDPVTGAKGTFHAGIDIGFTLIGMHLKKVAVPLRLENNKIGEATVLAARTRPKFIGGSRAVYDEAKL